MTNLELCTQFSLGMTTTVSTIELKHSANVAKP